MESKNLCAVQVERQGRMSNRKASPGHSLGKKHSHLNAYQSEIAYGHVAFF